MCPRLGRAAAATEHSAREGTRRRLGTLSSRGVCGAWLEVKNRSGSEALILLAHREKGETPLGGALR